MSKLPFTTETVFVIHHKGREISTRVNGYLPLQNGYAAILIDAENQRWIARVAEDGSTKITSGPHDVQKALAQAEELVAGHSPIGSEGEMALNMAVTVIMLNSMQAEQPGEQPGEAA